MAVLLVAPAMGAGPKPAPQRYIPARGLFAYVEFDGLAAHAEAWQATAAHAMLARTPAGAMMDEIARQVSDRFLKMVPGVRLTGADLVAVREHLVDQGFAIALHRHRDEVYSWTIVLNGVGRPGTRERLDRLFELMLAPMPPGKMPAPNRLRDRSVYQLTEPAAPMPAVVPAPGGAAPGNDPQRPAAPRLSWWFEKDDLVLLSVINTGIEGMLDPARRDPAAGVLPGHFAAVLDVLERKQPDVTTHPAYRAAVAEGTDIKGFDSDGLFFIESGRKGGLLAGFRDGAGGINVAGLVAGSVPRVGGGMSPYAAVADPQLGAGVPTGYGPPSRTIGHDGLPAPQATSYAVPGAVPAPLTGAAPEPGGVGASPSVTIPAIVPDPSPSGPGLAVPTGDPGAGTTPATASGPALPIGSGQAQVAPAVPAAGTGGASAPPAVVPPGSVNAPAAPAVASPAPAVVTASPSAIVPAAAPASYPSVPGLAAGSPAVPSAPGLPVQPGNAARVADAKKEAEFEKILGLDGLGRIVGRWGFQGKALLTDVRIEAASPRKGLVGLLDQPGFEKGQLPPIPRASASFVVDSFDPGAVYGRLVALARAVEPEAGGLIDHFEKATRDATGLRLREDLLNQLGPTWCVLPVPMPEEMDGGKGELDPEAFVLVGELEDPERFAKVLETLAARANQFLRDRERPGGQGAAGDGKADAPTIVLERLPAPLRGYRLTSPSRVVFWLNEAVQPTILVGKTAFVVAINPDRARQALALEVGNGARWRPTGELVRAFECLPSRLTFLSVGDPRASAVPGLIAGLPGYVQLLSTGLVGAADPALAVEPDVLTLVGIPGAGQFRLRIDPDKIPKEEDLRSHLFPSVFAAGVDAGGIRFIAREAFPMACTGDGAYMKTNIKWSRGKGLERDLMMGLKWALGG